MTMGGVTVQNDPSHKSRGEDSIIAWTWKAFVDDPSDPEILLRMPMTKVHCLVLEREREREGERERDRDRDRDRDREYNKVQVCF